MDLSNKRSRKQREKRKSPNTNRKARYSLAFLRESRLFLQSAPQVILVGNLWFFSQILNHPKEDSKSIHYTCKLYPLYFHLNLSFIKDDKQHQACWKSWGSRELKSMEVHNHAHPWRTWPRWIYQGYDQREKRKRTNKKMIWSKWKGS